MPPPITAMSKLVPATLPYSLLFDQGRRAFACIGEQHRPVRRQAHLARDAGRWEAPGGAISVLRDRNVAARDDQHDVVGRARRRGCRPPWPPPRPVGPAAARDDALGQHDFCQSSRASATLPTGNAARRPCSCRGAPSAATAGRDQHGRPAAPQDAKPRPPCHDARDRGQPPVNVDHALGTRHRHGTRRLQRAHGLCCPFSRGKSV